MKKIASCEGVDIFAPDHSRFSFLKSPYAAHKTFSAVDIYYGDFGSEAVSPVDGRIADIQAYNTPTPYKERDFTEYVIAVTQGRHVIKILHVRPEVTVGEDITKGERIGTFIHNGYFIFWNDPVMHVEVRRQENYLRASNDLRFTPAINWGSLPSSINLDIKGRVEEVNKRYALLSAPYETCGDVRGYAINGGFIDGYIASREGDGFFGIITPLGFFRPEVSLFEVTAGGRDVKCSGVAFSLYFNEPRIKVIPQRYGDTPLSRGERVRIRLVVRSS